MSAVDTLLTRLNLGHYGPAFTKAGVKLIVEIRNMDEKTLADLVPRDEDRRAIQAAVNRGPAANRAAAPGGAPQQEQQPGHSGPPPSYGQSDNGPKICRFHRTPQGCKKGDKCNLLHIDGPPIQSTRPPHQAGGDRASGDRAGGGFGGGAPRDSTGGPGAGGYRRTQRVCRDFFNPEGGCKYGDQCKYSHDPAHADGAEGGAPRGGGGDGIARETHVESVSVPWDSVKMLLGNKAERLNRINIQNKTTNSPIDRPDVFRTYYTFQLRGSKEGVARAKAQIEQLVGITSANNQEARFKHQHHELENNQDSCTLAAAANLKNKGTPMELSESVIKRLVGTFRFIQPPKIHHVMSLTSVRDSDKYEVVVKQMSKFKGIQAVIFTNSHRMAELVQRPQFTQSAFGVTPQFVYRDLSKADRLAALEAFKKGEVNEQGVKQRLLITTEDYAKLARKTLIPYVNMVLHLYMPRTKETYLLQAMCAGRQGTPGVSWLFVTVHDSSTIKEWEEPLGIKAFDGDDFAKIAETLVYDTVEKSLTSADADPEPDWRDKLKEEEQKKADKAAAAK